MALTASVEKESVVLLVWNCWSIRFGLTLKDGDAVVLRQSFTAVYKHGQAPAIVVEKVTEAMQAAIDQYQDEQELFNKSALKSTLDDAAKVIQSRLEVK